MTTDQQRVAFGLDIKRKLTPLGIRFAGIQYNANWLSPRIKSHRGKEMRIKVDPENMGRISVLVDNQWATLPGPPEVQGIPLSFWLAKCKSLALKHGAQASINFETVAKALLSFAKTSAAERCKAQLEDRSYNSKTLDNADRQIKLRFVYRPGPKSHAGPLQATKSLNGGGYQTGANLSLPVGAKAAPKTEEVKDEVFGLDLEDEADDDKGTLDDDLAADNDNVGEDPIPDLPAEADDVAAKAAAKVKGTPRPKTVVDTSWVPTPKLNKIKKSNGGH